MNWITWILLFTAGSLIANYIIRIIFQKKAYFHKEFIKMGYEKGYRDGATNVKMFHSFKGELPPVTWLQKNRGKLLDTREKLLGSLDGEN